MSTVSNSFASSACHVVDRDCRYKYSFTHELGHNLGCRHDWYVDTKQTPYFYGHGYVLWVEVPWYLPWMRTIMAYDELCQDKGRDRERIKVFSNPDIEVLGLPLGIEDGADNARVVNATGGTVSRFR